MKNVKLIEVIGYYSDYGDDLTKMCVEVPWTEVTDEEYEALAVFASHEPTAHRNSRVVLLVEKKVDPPVLDKYLERAKEFVIQKKKQEAIAAERDKKRQDAYRLRKEKRDAAKEKREKTTLERLKKKYEEENRQ